MVENSVTITSMCKKKCVHEFRDIFMAEYRIQNTCGPSTRECSVLHAVYLHGVSLRATIMGWERNVK